MHVRLLAEESRHLAHVLRQTSHRQRLGRIRLLDDESVPVARAHVSRPGKFVACSDSGTDTKAPVWYKCSVNNHLRHHGGPCVTTDTVPQTVLFPDLFDKPLFAQFNQEQASSDGGAILLKAAERIYGLVKAFAGCLFDKRAPDKTRHSLADLIGQRIFGIACGHPDCNDGDRLADDPIHKLLLDRDPVSGERLASQPTLSRFENAVNGCALYRMADELATRVIARHRRRLDGRARCITIDLDPTDDPTHGAQQYTLFNGYYDNWWCVQQRLVCSAGDSPAGVIVRSPVAWIAGRRETELLKPIDKVSLGEICESSGHNASERTSGLDSLFRRAEPATSGRRQHGRLKAD